MPERKPTKRPRLFAREKQTPKTGEHGRRKEYGEKKTDTENKRTQAYLRESNKANSRVTRYSLTVKQARRLNNIIPKESASQRFLFHQVSTKMSIALVSKNSLDNSLRLPA